MVMGPGIGQTLTAIDNGQHGINIIHFILFFNKNDINTYLHE